MTKKRLTNDVPLSEKVEKQQIDFDAEMCIAELQRVARQNPDKFITRNFFRSNGVISDSTWSKYFGTFSEYRKAAGLELSRAAQKLEREIAKHSSVDNYREYNKERQDYTGKYKRDNSARFQLVLTISDLHDIEVDPFYMRVLIDTIKRAGPDKIVLNGDIVDLPEFGRFTVDPRQWDVVGRVRFMHNNILKPIRNAAPDAELIYIEGNHEFRLLRHLADSTPAMKVLLSDLHGFTVSKLLGLDEFEVNYIAKGDLSAYTAKNIKDEVSKSYVTLYDCFLSHHTPEGKNYGMPGVNGHHHSFRMYAMYNEVFGSYNWLQVGGGHKRDAEYCNGQKWQTGFALHHIDTHKKLVQHEPVIITESVCVGGKYYFREGQEQ